MEESGLSRKKQFLLVSLVLALSAVIRFSRLGAQSLWVDEILSVGVFSGSEQAPFWKKLLHDVHGPLYPLFMHFWSKVASSDAWLRVPSAASGVATVFLLHRWLHRIAGFRVAIVGALFLAINPFHLYYSQEVRFYSFLALFSVASLICFERFLKKPSSSSGALLGVMLGFACLAHISASFLLAAFAIYLVAARKLRGPCCKAAILAAVIAISIASPLIYREILHLKKIEIVPIAELPIEKRLRGETTLTLWAYPYSIYAFSVGYSFGPSLQELHELSSSAALVKRHWMALASVLVVFGPLALMGLLRTLREKSLGYLLLSVAMAFLAVTAATAANVKVFNVRYLICIFPIYIGFLAIGLPSKKLILVAAIAAVCAISLKSSLGYLFDPRYAREDVRGAAAIVQQNEEFGDAIIIPTVHDVFLRYYRGANEIKVLYPADLSEDELKARLSSLFEAHARIWYLRARHWDKDPRDILVKMLPVHGNLIASWELPGVKLLLYEK